MRRPVLALIAILATTPAHAQGLITTHRIPAVLANQAVAAAVEACAKQGYAETVVLVDADGVRQAVLRGDKTGSHGLDSAFDKAYTAATMRRDTIVFRDQDREAGKTLADWGLDPQMTHLVGGTVLMKDGELWGGLGVGGNSTERDDAERRLFSLLRDPRVHRTASPPSTAPSDRPTDDEPGDEPGASRGGLPG